MLQSGRAEKHCDDSRGMIEQRATYRAYFRISSALLYANCSFLRGCCWIIHQNSNEHPAKARCVRASLGETRTQRFYAICYHLSLLWSSLFLFLPSRLLPEPLSFLLFIRISTSDGSTFESTVLAPLSPSAGLFFLLTTPVFAFYRFALRLVGVMELDNVTRTLVNPRTT